MLGLLIFVFLAEGDACMPNENEVFQFYHEVRQARSTQSKGIKLNFSDYLKIQWKHIFKFCLLSNSEAKK